MRISFIVNPIYINGGWSPWDDRIGGSEECVKEWSWRLAAKGHYVQVFHNGQHGVYKDVEYLPHEEFTPGDVTVNVNYPQFSVDGKAVYYSTLTENPNLDQFEAVMCLSQYAKDHTNLPDRAIILPPGYDPTHIYPPLPTEKITKQCFYASSPDRGLDTLLEAWSKVSVTHPDATLLVTYGGQSDLPGVINLGEADEETMDSVYRTSDIWCHPCSGGELFGITGKKAQAAACIPVIIPTMALKETVARGFFAANADDYAQVLIDVLNMSMETRNTIRQDVLKHAELTTWDESTDKLEQIVQSVV